MAVYEQDVLMKYKDTSGDTTLLYPITKANSVDGLLRWFRADYDAAEGDGTAYTVSCDNIGVLLVPGINITIVPNVTSTSNAVTLNVNNTGAKYIRRRVSGSTGTTSTWLTEGWLVADKPIRLTYDGNFWIADQTKPSATDLMGTVAIANGGTGATTADAARANLGAVAATTRTISLYSANWSSNSQTLTVTGASASNIVFVSPDPASYVAYGEAGVRCSGQATNSLTFTCTDTPSADLIVNAVILG